LSTAKRARTPVRSGRHANPPLTRAAADRQADGASLSGHTGSQPEHDDATGRATIFTVGHSTRTLEELIAMLAGHGVVRLVDVRTVPRSRHNPQFNRDTLPQALQAAGIAYVHMAALGGLRKPRADSANTGWRNLSFRGYADYMQTEAFTQGLDELLTLAGTQPVALMCAEAVPWRCHRSLIADALAARGIPVEEIVDAKRRTPHRLTPFAVVQDRTVRYPPPAGAAAQQGELFTAAEPPQALPGSRPARPRKRAVVKSST
jgi:hypothetical protein